jgi:hypothetical protein
MVEAAPVDGELMVEQALREATAVALDAACSRLPEKLLQRLRDCFMASAGGAGDWYIPARQYDYRLEGSDWRGRVHRRRRPNRNHRRARAGACHSQRP